MEEVLPRPGKAQWREEALPHAIAAGGTVVLLVLGWKLASGLAPVVFPTAQEEARLRLVFSARAPERVAVAPAAPAVAPAIAGVVPSTPEPHPLGPVRDATLPPAPAGAAPPSPAPDLFGEDGRPRLPAGVSDRWNPAPAPVPGSTGAPVPDETARRLLERPNPVDPRRTRFAGAWKSDGDLADVTAQQIARAQRRIADFLFGKDIQHARARPSPELRFNPARHEQPADLGSEATGDAYKAAPIGYEPAPGLDGEASRRIREQVAALETAYARCDRARLQGLMQPLLAHLDELQKAEAAHARGADPVRAEHMLPNAANGAYDMARRALWYADSRMAGCGG